MPINRDSAFTLIELLVVVTISTVLLALLMPTMERAVTAAEKAVCASHVHQVGVSNLQYALENRGKLVFPTYNTTDTTTLFLTGGVKDFGNPAVYRDYPNYLSVIGAGGGQLVCPAIKSQPWPGQGATLHSYTNYQGNAAVFGASLSRLDRASDLALIQELRGGTNTAWYRPWWEANNRRATFWHFDGALSIPEAYGTAHDQSPETPKGGDGGGGGNLLWADGHVSFHALDSLTAGDFGLTGDNAQAGINGNAADTHNDADSLKYLSRYK